MRLTVTDVVNENPLRPRPSIISEVTPWSSGNAPYAADWFEVTNTGTERREHHRLEDGRQLERVRQLRSP